VEEGKLTAAILRLIDRNQSLSDDLHGHRTKLQILKTTKKKKEGNPNNAGRSSAFTCTVPRSHLVSRKQT
jgi:hypothetical protein